MSASEVLSLALVHSRHMSALSVASTELFRSAILTELRERVERRVAAAQIILATRTIARDRAHADLKSAEAALEAADAEDLAAQRALFEAKLTTLPEEERATKRFSRGMSSSKLFFARERLSDCRRHPAFDEHNEAYEWLEEANHEMEWLNKHPEAATDREMIRIASGKRD